MTVKTLTTNCKQSSFKLSPVQAQCLTEYGGVSVSVGAALEARPPSPAPALPFNVDDVCRPGNTLLWDLLQDGAIVSRMNNTYFMFYFASIYFINQVYRLTLALLGCILKYQIVGCVIPGHSLYVQYFIKIRPVVSGCISNIPTYFHK